jgi:hypothetical protein
MAEIREAEPAEVERDSADSRVEARRFYEREEPSWTSRCFAWEL